MFNFAPGVSLLTVEQGSDEWLAARAGRVTGSKIDTVTANGRGGKPSATRATLVAEVVAEVLTGLPCGSNFKSSAMQWGNDMEPMAREAYESKTGRLVTQLGFLQHAEKFWGSSLDGKIDDELDLEIKCPNTVTHLAYLEEGAPMKYIKQMQWNMGLSGAKACDFVTFDPRLPAALQLRVFRIERNDQLISELQEQADEFMAEVFQKIEHIKGL